MKKLLVIAYRFPPSASSGTFRSLGFVRHLVNMGWAVQVLTVCEASVESPDHNLFDKLPEDVKIYRAPNIDIFSWWSRIGSKRFDRITDGINNDISLTYKKKYKLFNSLKELLTQFLKTPDNQIGWFFPALIKSIFIHRPDVIYSSAPPFTGHLIAVILKKIWRIPFVCDFRDPWMENPFREKRPGWVEKWERLLEEWVYKNADIIIANTEPMADAFRKRHPNAGFRINVITNGYDPEDFLGVKSIRDHTEDYFCLAHPGSIYGQRDPRPFLEGLKIVVHERECRQIKVHLIGSIEKFGRKTLENHVKELGLQDHVDLIGSVPHAEALGRMKGTDMLLLFAQGTDLQVPAKIYEYMGIKKPIFAICETNSATEGIIRSLGSGHLSCANEPEEIAIKLVKLYKRFDAGNDQLYLSQIKMDTKPYIRSSLTRRLEKLLMSCLELKDS